MNMECCALHRSSIISTLSHRWHQLSQENINLFLLPMGRKSSSVGQNSQQSPTISRRSRLLSKFGWRSASPSPSPSTGIECRNSTSGQSTATPVSQSLTVPTSVRTRPHSSHSGGPALQTCAPSSHSSAIWLKALEIAKQKLNENNLPPLDLTTLNLNLTAQSAEENIHTVIKGLNSLQEDDKKKRWSYTWRGKKVIVIERLGKILKCLEKYTKVVDTAIQANPQVSALVWAGIWAIIRVRIFYTLSRYQGCQCTPNYTDSIGRSP